MVICGVDGRAPVWAKHADAFLKNSFASATTDCPGAPPGQLSQDPRCRPGCGSGCRPAAPTCVASQTNTRTSPHRTDRRPLRTGSPRWSTPTGQHVPHLRRHQSSHGCIISQPIESAGNPGAGHTTRRPGPAQVGNDHMLMHLRVAVPTSRLQHPRCGSGCRYRCGSVCGSGCGSGCRYGCGSGCRPRVRVRVLAIIEFCS